MYRGVEGKAMMRINGIIVMNPDIDKKMWLQDDEEMYRIGKVRTLQRFFYSFGIDTVEKRVHAHLCKFVGNNMHVIWKKHLREDGMGIKGGIRVTTRNH